MISADSPDGEGWIEWNAGECPVPDETLIDVKWRGDPEPYIEIEAGRLRRFGDSWRHEGPDWRHIVAYRLHVPREALEARISELEARIAELEAKLREMGVEP